MIVVLEATGIGLLNDVNRVGLKHSKDNRGGGFALLISLFFVWQLAYSSICPQPIFRRESWATRQKIYYLVPALYHN